MFLFCLFAIVHVVVGELSTNDATTSITACHRSDPEINTCLLEQASKVVKRLQNGAPEYNMDPLDPLHVDFMTAEGDLEDIKLKMVMKNITLYGHSDTKFHRIKFDPNSLSGEISLIIPVVRMTCDYFATGRLFVIPLESSAHFDGNFTKMEVTLNFRLKNVIRKGTEYLSVDKLTLKMNLESGHMKMISIDPAQQPQVNIIEDFYNENDKLVIKTVIPIANEQGSHFYKHILERYLRKIPANELLPY